MNSIRRLALGVALTGAAACAVPAIASAADSTCTYATNLREVDITDNSGNAPLTVLRSTNGFIEVADNGGPPHLCFSPATIATVDNTDTIVINGPSSGGLVGDGYVLDQSGGPLKSNVTGRQIKTIGFATGSLPDLTVIGTSGPDKIRIGGNAFIDVNGDGTSDFSNFSGAHQVNVFGAGDRDQISGTGLNSGSGSSVQLNLHGGDGKDTLSGGKAQDLLSGDGDDDTLISSDLATDLLFGGSGFDTAIVDAKDQFGDNVERRILDHSVAVGGLRLAPGVGAKQTEAAAGRIRVAK